MPIKQVGDVFTCGIHEEVVSSSCVIISTTRFFRERPEPGISLQETVFLTQKIHIEVVRVVRLKRETQLLKIEE